MGMFDSIGKSLTSVAKNPVGAVTGVVGNQYRNVSDGFSTIGKGFDQLRNNTVLPTVSQGDLKQAGNLLQIGGGLKAVGGMLGLGGGGGDAGASKGPGALLKKWDALGQGITGAEQQRMTSQAMGNQMGSEATARGALAMRGGMTGGGAERLARQGMWDRLNASSGIATNQANKLLEHQQKGIDLQAKVMAGQDASAAQKAAAKKAGNSQLGSILGGIGGFMIGGPAGAGIGSQAGAYLGSQV